MEKKIIDVKKQIKKSNNKLLNSLPEFVLNIITRIVKEKEINYILNKYEDFHGVDFLPKVLEELNISIEVDGFENLPENTKCFFFANHPFGFVDGLVLTSLVVKKYGTFKAIGNENFMLIPNLKNVIAAVNVFGKNPKDYLLELENVYKSDTPITHFPAGRVSRLQNGKVLDGVWQKSFIKKSIQHQRDIVPFYFHGKNSNLFYAIFFIRKIFFIKANIELMLLPHEIFNKRNKTIKVTIGKPISYKTFNDSYSHHEWAQKVKKMVYELRIK